MSINLFLDFVAEWPRLSMILVLLVSVFLAVGLYKLLVWCGPQEVTEEDSDWHKMMINEDIIMSIKEIRKDFHDEHKQQLADTMDKFEQTRKEYKL